jgi:amidase
MWNGAAVENCLSRSVRDSAAYLDAIQGAAPGDPYEIKPPQRPYLQEVTTSPGKLRIGYTAEHTLDKAVGLLKSEGHTLEEVQLPYLKEDLTEVFLVVIAGEVAGDLSVLSRWLGRKVRPSDVEPSTYALSLLGKSFSAGDYAFAKQKWGEIALRIAGFYDKYDLLLTPTLALRPIRTGALQPKAAERRLMAVVNTFGLGGAVRATINQLAGNIYRYMPWTAFANLTGQPSMSVPMHWTKEENLPVGVMFTGRFGAEDVLYRLAGQLEQAAPWADKFPPE